ncbi:MAG TPA: histidine triad nucleotide-binding protein [Rhodocyclaceae bacterium]|nr:histidine triad nucleotide-binding protein [Rhodocyclaceae bacterium]
MSNDCLFCRIARGEIPARLLYEDEEIMAFHDIHPQRPVHFLMIPKQHIASLMEADMSHQAVLGRLLAKAGELARSQGLNDGFRTIVNTGRIGGQEVAHIHLHILGGPEMLGPMLTSRK